MLTSQKVIDAINEPRLCQGSGAADRSICIGVIYRSLFLCLQVRKSLMPLMSK